MTTNDMRAEFEAHLATMPEWAPEFEAHRAWVEKLMFDAYAAGLNSKREPPTQAKPVAAGGAPVVQPQIYACVDDVESACKEYIAAVAAVRMGPASLERCALAEQALIKIVTQPHPLAKRLPAPASEAPAQAEPVAAQAVHERLLTAEARVGNSTFYVGVPERLVIEAAQRAAQHSQGMDDEAGKQLRAMIAEQAGRAAFLDAHPALSQELADLIEENERLKSMIGPDEQKRADIVNAASQWMCEREPLSIPPEIAAIIENLHTQDNRITDNPLFAVQQKRRVYGLDEDYEDGHGWAHPDRDSLVLEGEAEYAELKAAWESGEEPQGDWRRVGFKDTWEFVTGCLTEQGCKDFIRVNGHNLNEPRIYAYGSYRNAEFIALRKWLMSLRAHGIGADHNTPKE